MNEYTSINGGGFQVPNPSYDDILLRQGYGGQDGVAAQCNLLPLESSSLVSCVSITDIRHVHYDAILLRQGYGGQDGNVIALTNSTGTISARYRYSPFGELISSQDLDSSGWNERNLHRFSTKPELAGTGLLYYGYRWYDPATGRWPSRDPIEESGGDNLYAFCFNSPLRSVDPKGLNVRVDFKCSLISSSGKVLKNCEYECTETRRDQSLFGDGPNLDDMPPAPIMMTTSTQDFCKCDADITTFRIFMADDLKIDCSRSSCRERCEAAFKIAKKSKKPVVIAAAHAARVTCIDTCNTICNKP